MKYIDLFCGIGGFHQAIEGECVFASDIDESARKVYHKNYGLEPSGDITKIDEKDIPQHDLLCGGFPCQAFSSAGHQKGFSESRGTLFFEIERILRHHKPKYILLENVQNLVKHDSGNTWRVITSILKDIGYRIPDVPLIVSPVDIGTPQLRPRVLIPGVYAPGDTTPISIKINTQPLKSIYTILEDSVDDKYKITDYENYVLEMWDDFYKGLQPEKIVSPVICDYFDYKGDTTGFPKWKIDYINKNRAFYLKNKAYIDSWLAKYNNLSDVKPTHKKMEWQAGKKINSVFEGLIQFRQSGIRIKKPDAFPALVAIVQTSIVGKYRRRLTPRECARLQDFPDSFQMDTVEKMAYKQFGNAVNVQVIRSVYEQLIKF